MAAALVTLSLALLLAQAIAVRPVDSPSEPAPAGPVPEVDRIWNFQVVWGGVKRITRRGPGLMLEFHNHHISNAGTRGENLGVNVAMEVAGVHWVLR